MKHFMARRVQNMGASIFTEMSALAVEHAAINLGQGFPDFAGPPHIKQAAIDAIGAEHNQYAPSMGILPLREAVAATYRGYGIDATAAHVTITSGATEALFAAAMALVDPGDEVIVFEPAYDGYAPDVRMAGGTPRFVRLHPPTALQGTGIRDQGVGASGQVIQPATPNPQPPTLRQDWGFDPAELRAAFNGRTKAIIVNTPTTLPARCLGATSCT